jgi:tellurite resistance protein TerC
MQLWLWGGFLLLVLSLLALDLGVFHRRPSEISFREALAWTAVWFILAMGFNALVYFLYEHHLLGVGLHVGQNLGGPQASLHFFTGYIVEKSLSLDNIFIIAVIFNYFKVPLALQHRVLFWGILGALAMRGAMIAAGAALLHSFEWTIYVFGSLLLFTAAKMLVTREENIEPEKNLFVRLARRFYPVTDSFHDDHFTARILGRRAITPLMIVLIVVETTDVLFAVDSIPAIFAITTDPFLVFTSNVFAILGLRSLYFALASLMEQLKYLKTSLVFVLAFVGVKMLLTNHYPIPITVSLAVIAGTLAVAVIASLLTIWREGGRLAHDLELEINAIALTTLRQARRLVIAVIGGTILLIGIVMIVLPGPAFLVIPAGLMVLATEFAWARFFLNKVKAKIFKKKTPDNNPNPPTPS